MIRGHNRMVSANPEDLAELYRAFERSMHDADAVITALANAKVRAEEAWDSKYKEQFIGEWESTLRPSLITLCQALATHGTNVAHNYNDFKVAGRDATLVDLPDLVSPR